MLVGVFDPHNLFFPLDRVFGHFNRLVKQVVILKCVHVKPAVNSDFGRLDRIPSQSTNLQQLGDGDVPLLDRLESGGKAFGNWVLYTTCGYGERLWRVIYISVVIVLAWGLFYTVLTKGTEGAVSSSGLDSPLELLSSSGFVMLGKNIYFSIVTFTTLGYGDVRPVGTVARALAGVESFLGALLLALVVFVLGRRVAW